MHDWKKMKKIIILIPVYNDWESLSKLLDEIDKTIQEIIGVDFKTFSQLVYQNTNKSLQFLTATDTNRKKFLIDLLHLENYVELFDLFKEEARVIALEINGIQSKIDTIEKWLVDNKLSDTNILPMLKLEISTEEEEKQFRHLTKEIENISEKNKKISKNNQLLILLKQIDLQEAQNCAITERFFSIISF